MGGHHYVVPATGVPYLGHGLDWSLFNVSALAAHETAGRLPVRISYGTRLHALPGVTVTGSSGGVESGYLTAASVALAGAAAPARPDLPMHVLTVTATNISGQADTGDIVFVVNEDNSALFGDPYESMNDFYRGSTKFSVPAGNYFAFGMFFDPSGATPPGRAAALQRVGGGGVRHDGPDGRERGE